MNIFALDYDPIKAAKMLCDKHIVKMPLESVQLLSTYAFDNGFDVGYKPTHAGHPCSVWLRASRKNLRWFMSYTEELFLEFIRRRDKCHASHSVYVKLAHNLIWTQPNDLIIKKPSDDLVLWLEEGKKQNLIKDLISLKPNGSIKIVFNDIDKMPFIDFYPAMPKECRIGKDSVEMYKNYYRTEKKNIVSYNWKPERGEWYEIK